MNEREWVERFNQDLDLLVQGSAAPDSEDTPAECRQDLELARRLIETDFSAASARETLLQQRLMPYAEMQLQRQARWKSILEPLVGMKPTLAWVALTVFILVVLNWTLRNVIPVIQPGEVEPVVVEENAVRGSDYVQFRSERYHLNVALPSSWAAVEGKESLEPGFSGWVAFNSWGEEGFWARAAGYTPGSVLDQLPADGAYIVLAVQESEAPEEGYGPEQTEPELETFWTGKGCQEAGEPAGYSPARFFKWGRLMRLEVICGRRVSEETAGAVTALLESWNFDPAPAGDAGWATASTRLLLPEEAGPEAFPIITSDLVTGSPVVRSVRDGEVLRTTQAEILDGSVVAVTHLYRRGISEANPVTQDCPKEDCHRWDFEARPDGSLVLVSQEGAALAVAAEPAQDEESASVSGVQESQPDPTATAVPPVEPLNSWSHPDEIRERLEESWALWKTLWVDALVTTTYDGEVQVSREQIWIEQPDEGLWLSGPPDGSPVEIRITSQGLSAIYDLEKSALREFDHPNLVPSLLNKMVYPSWSIALRKGRFEAIRRDEVAGRMTLVADYTNVEGQVSDRFWVDTVTGVILRWAHFTPQSGGRGVSQEVVVNAIAYDVEFTEGLFDPELPPPQAFTFDYFLDRKKP
ncbi:MAG TPA: hypothetical protein VGA03_10010 [Anaerolineales bacterium]